MYKLFLFVIVLLLFAKSKSLRDYEIDWSNYESWDQCNKNDNWKFQEGRCIKSRMLDLYEEITDLRLYSFKNSKTLNKAGSFSIIHSDEINKEIYILGDGDSWLKTVWDWDLFKNYYSTYDIKIKRSWFVNEVITTVYQIYK